MLTVQIKMKEGRRTDVKVRLCDSVRWSCKGSLPGHPLQPPSAPDVRSCLVLSSGLKQREARSLFCFHLPDWGSGGASFPRHWPTPVDDEGVWRPVFCVCDGATSLAKRHCIGSQGGLRRAAGPFRQSGRGLAVPSVAESTVCGHWT